MILIGLGLVLVLVLAISVVVIAFCAVRACRILARMAALIQKLHLQFSNLLKVMPKDFDLTDIWRRGGR